MSVVSWTVVLDGEWSRRATATFIGQFFRRCKQAGVPWPVLLACRDRIRAAARTRYALPAPERLTGIVRSPNPREIAALLADPPRKPREFFIHGITAAGRPFRPSDWAERLCGVMSGYRPGGTAMGRDAHIGYSPYVRPMLLGGVKCVVVDERLNDLEPMAFSFVMNFAKDNDLPVYEGCTMPDRGS